ncbi:hypothetical protein OAV88_01030 [bacterium]|nr:hypothetical protein [bacterium]
MTISMWKVDCLGPDSDESSIGLKRNERGIEFVTNQDENDVKRNDHVEELSREFEGQVAFYEDFGLTKSESESLARAGFFLVPFDITEDRCKTIMENMQAVRLTQSTHSLASTLTPSAPSNTESRSTQTTKISKTKQSGYQAR